MEGSLFMKNRIGLFLFAGALALMPSRGFAQTCTLGPFTSATPLSTINSQISSAQSGAIVCLQRGQVWSAASGLSISASHPGASRVTICASTGTSCTDSGAANPRIAVTGTCVSLNGGGGGYNISNLDCYNSDANNGVKAWGIDHGTHDVTISGGVIDGFWQAAYLDGGSGADADKIKWGVCGHPVEIRGGPALTDRDRSVSWGGLTNSSISLWIHDFNGPSSGSHSNTSHWIDLAQNGNLSPTTSSHDVTFECGLYQFTNSSAGTSLLKINRGYHIVFRDNTFQVVAGKASTSVISLADHAAGGTEGITGSGVNCAGAEIYRNKFLGGSAIFNGIGADICVYNNIFDWTNSGDAMTGVMAFHYETAAAGDTPISNVRIYNNTIYKNSGIESFPSLVRDNPGTPTRTLPSNNALFNNLVWDTTPNSLNAAVWGSNCGTFGANGANIKNNFVYTPNDSTPGIWSGCSAASGTNSAPYNTDPGLVDAKNGNFALATGSVLAGKGIAAGAPSNGDFLQNARQSPPSIGAYEVVSGVAPLQPPVLIQITTN